MNTLSKLATLLFFSIALISASCKRMNDSEVPGQSKPTATSPAAKKVLGASQPDVSDQKPLAPGSVRVIVQIEKFLTDLENETGSDEQQRVQAKVVSVLGYGSGFNHTLANEQSIKVYFPMPIKTQHDGKELKVQDKVDVHLQAPMQENDWFTVTAFSKLDK